jgi:hypothetical protein
MKKPMLTSLLGLVLVAGAAAGQDPCSVPTNAPARIELRDQFDKPRVLTFPTTNLIFLTIADKAGSEQIAAWIAPVNKRFREAVVIEGIADVSAVPRPLRGWVRRKFQKAQSHPVMLDWSGEKVKAFAPEPGRANIFVLDYDGKILKRLSGVATTECVSSVCDVIQEALAAGDKRAANR